MTRLARPLAPLAARPTVGRAAACLAVGILLALACGAVALAWALDAHGAFVDCQRARGGTPECGAAGLARGRATLAPALLAALGLGAASSFALGAAPAVLVVRARRREEAALWRDRLRRAEEMYARGHLDARTYAAARQRFGDAAERGPDGAAGRDLATLLAGGALGVLALGVPAAAVAGLLLHYTGAEGSGRAWLPGGAVLLPALAAGLAAAALALAAGERRAARARAEPAGRALEDAWQAVLDEAAARAGAQAAP